MKIAIKTLAGLVLYEGYFSGLKEALIAAVEKGADLQGADLQGAKVNWSSHALIEEILFRAARDDVEKRKVAGLVAVSTDWCWDRLLKESAKDPLRKWALTELRKWVQPDDGAPEILTNK